MHAATVIGGAAPVGAAEGGSTETAAFRLRAGDGALDGDATRFPLALLLCCLPGEAAPCSSGSGGSADAAFTAAASCGWQPRPSGTSCIPCFGPTPCNISINVLQPVERSVTDSTCFAPASASGGPATSAPAGSAALTAAGALRRAFLLGGRFFAAVWLPCFAGNAIGVDAFACSQASFEASVCMGLMVLH